MEMGNELSILLIAAAGLIGVLVVFLVPRRRKSAPERAELKKVVEFRLGQEVFYARGKRRKPGKATIVAFRSRRGIYWGARMLNDSGNRLSRPFADLTPASS
jgi:hypothetical protein